MVDKAKAQELRSKGMTYKEISEELKCSEAWCKKNLKEDKQKKMQFQFGQFCDKLIMYEFYDANKSCLYVGSTSNFPNRVRSHKRESAFYGQAFYVKVTEVLCVPELLFVEAQQIILKQPKYNTYLLSGKPSPIQISGVFLGIFSVQGGYRIDEEF